MAPATTRSFEGEFHTDGLSLAPNKTPFVAIQVDVRTADGRIWTSHAEQVIYPDVVNLPKHKGPLRWDKGHGFRSPDGVIKCVYSIQVALQCWDDKVGITASVDNLHLHKGLISWGR